MPKKAVIKPATENQKTPPQIVICPGCGTKHPLTAVERPLGNTGDIDVGIECPYYHHWTHSYYLNPRLKSLQDTLERLRKRANRSEKHWHRYKNKQAEYQRLFDELNQRSLEARQPSVIARLEQVDLPAGLSITEFIDQASQVLGANGGNHGPSN